MYAAFLKLADTECLVVGGGRIAERKTAALLAAGARPTVVAPTATPQLTAWARAGRIAWQARAYQPGEAAGFFLTIGATDDRAVNARVAADAAGAGRLVNVVDVPDLSNFFAPATVQRGDLQVAVSTGGACPPLAGRIRDGLSVHLPEAYAPLLARLRTFREGLRAREPDADKRRQTLERIVTGPELPAYLRGERDPLERLLTQCG